MTAQEKDQLIEKLYTGISRAAWGYFFLYFNLDINMGGSTVSVLPAFVGMALFLSSINLLKEERRNLALLRPFAVILLVWYLICWGADVWGVSMNERFAVVSLVADLMGMYFHFQLMTDFAGLARTYAPDEPELEIRLLRWRTIQTVMLALLIILSYVRELLPVGMSGFFVYAMLAAGIVQMVAGICLMAGLFSLRKKIRTDPKKIL